MPRTERGQHEATGLSGAEHVRADARAAIDAETSAAILAGFDYAIDPVSYTHLTLPTIYSV